jgi:PTS system mannose-specific IIA component
MMMTGIVIVTHGRLSEVMIETAAFILGPQEDLKSVAFHGKDSVEDLKVKTLSAVEPYKESACLVLTDIIGGSATNVCSDLLQLKNVHIITGINLPMLLEALMSRPNMPVDQLAKKVKEGAVRGIVDVKDFFAARMAKKRV